LHRRKKHDHFYQVLLRLAKNLVEMAKGHQNLKNACLCVGKPGIGAGREIKNMPRKIICCFVTSPKKDRRSTVSGISQAISPGGFFVTFCAADKK
jgi:hypothetical protein